LARSPIAAAIRGGGTSLPGVRAVPALAYAATQFYVYWTLVILTLGPEEIASAGVLMSAWAGAVAGACLVAAAALIAHPLACASEHARAGCSTRAFPGALRR
jgi:hypothetical protein